jgi:serine/threonine protein kinase
MTSAGRTDDTSGSGDDLSTFENAGLDAGNARGQPGELSGMAGMGIPQFIGRYHIRRLIGHGGMGAVYEAIQEQPRRVVALKVLRTGAATRSALRRFIYESQILGRLKHAGIAQVYEAGTHMDNGVRVPFFAMEYIASARYLTEFAEQKDLSTDQRIALFIKVCDAVHHGHQKGIVHRDLKPQNILVDSEGNPKIIDFGVARATDSDMAVTTQQTDVGSLVGTLQYMSPEQVAADPNDIDTRSDVYALGVILYELVCRVLPYDVSKTPVPEAVRIVREQNAARPTSVSAFVKRDLEVIILKTLEKDRDRRYRSAADLADDLRRYISAEPVSARRASLAYQLKLFAKRNRTVVIAASIVFASLLLTTALSIRIALAASKDQSELRKFTQFMNMFINAGLPTLSKSNVISLEDAGNLATRTFAHDPDAEAMAHFTIAKLYANGSDWSKSAEQAIEAMRLERIAIAGAHADERFLWPMAEVAAKGLIESGRRDESLRVLEPLLKDWKNIPNEQVTGVLSLMDLSLVAHARNEDWKSAESVLVDRLDATERSTKNPAAKIRVLHNLSLVEARLGRRVQAQKAYNDAETIRERARRDGQEDSLGKRDPATEQLWPDGGRLGVASAALLRELEVWVPLHHEPPAYVFELAARYKREFVAGGAFYPAHRVGNESSVVTFRRVLRDAWNSYLGDPGTGRAPSPEGFRKYVYLASERFKSLSENCDRFAAALDAIEGLPLGRASRWATQRTFLEAYCPEAPDGSSPLFTYEDFDRFVRGPDSPAVNFRSAWKILTRPGLTMAQYAKASELAAKTKGFNSLRERGDRADYATAVAVADYRLGRWDAAAKGFAATLELVRKSPDQRAQCGEDIPLIFGACACLSIESKRTLGFKLMGEAVSKAPVLSVDLTPAMIAELRLCEPGAGSVAIDDWEAGCVKLFIDELTAVSERPPPPVEQQDSPPTP